MTTIRFERTARREILYWATHPFTVSISLCRGLAVRCTQAGESDIRVLVVRAEGAHSASEVKSGMAGKDRQLVPDVRGRRERSYRPSEMLKITQ